MTISRIATSIMNHPSLALAHREPLLVGDDEYRRVELAGIRGAHRRSQDDGGGVPEDDRQLPPPAPRGRVGGDARQLHTPQQA